MVIKGPDVLPAEPPEEARSLPKHQLHVVAEPDHGGGDGDFDHVDHVDGDGGVDGVYGDVDGVGVYVDDAADEEDEYDLLTP